jgi:hypothetical protein
MKKFLVLLISFLIFSCGKKEKVVYELVVTDKYEVHIDNGILGNHDNHIIVYKYKEIRTSEDKVSATGWTETYDNVSLANYRRIKVGDTFKNYRSHNIISVLPVK